MFDALMTATELAGRLGVSARTVGRWGREEKIPRIVLSPKVIRYRWVAVLDFFVRMNETKARDGKATRNKKEGR